MKNSVTHCPSREGTAVPQLNFTTCQKCGKPLCLLKLGNKSNELTLAIVHLEDAIALNLSQVSFYADVNRRRKDGTRLVYARRRAGDRPGVRLHTLIAELHGIRIERNKTVVDHENGDTLDNRWGCNLRAVSIGVNNRNKPPKGVVLQLPLLQEVG